MARPTGWRTAVRRAVAAVAISALAALAAPSPVIANGGSGGLSPGQRSALYGIARDTWAFYAADVDPVTHLPLDNLGPGSTRGAYTSAANIGVYLWAVVAAHDLGLIDRSQAASQIRATLTEVGTLKRFDGLLYQWYDTTNGNVLVNPGQADCSESTPAKDNCWFVSAVDNGWYASGLIEVRQALPELRGLVNQLLGPMNFGIFYDGRPQTACNTNASLPGTRPPARCMGATTSIRTRPVTTTAPCTATPASPCT